MVTRRGPSRRPAGNRDGPRRQRGWRPSGSAHSSVTASHSPAATPSKPTAFGVSAEAQQVGRAVAAAGQDAGDIHVVAGLAPAERAATFEPTASALLITGPSDIVAGSWWRASAARSTRTSSPEGWRTVMRAKVSARRRTVTPIPSASHAAVAAWTASSSPNNSAAAPVTSAGSLPNGASPTSRSAAWSASTPKRSAPGSTPTGTPSTPRRRRPTADRDQPRAITPSRVPTA